MHNGETAELLRRRGLPQRQPNPGERFAGYQWVVQEQLAAAFGALLAGGLVENPGARTAFGIALAGLRLPGPDLVHHRARCGAVSKQIATDFGISESYLTNSLKAADVKDAVKPGTTSAENTKLLRDARRRIRLLEQANEVLRWAAGSSGDVNHGVEESAGASRLCLRLHPPGG